jgi:hypothetical protein
VTLSKSSSRELVELAGVGGVLLVPLLEGAE